MNEKQIVAAFDFDGTLTYRDTLIPFLFMTAGFCKVILTLLKNLPKMSGYFFGLSTRQQIKEALLKDTIGGISLEKIKEKGIYFSQKLLPAKLKPEGMKKLNWHLSQGHRCILVSANLDVYLNPWGKQERFQDVICSILQANDEGNVTGLLAGKNCRGMEKRRRLLDLLGDRNNFILYAYGDSAGDKELLEMADYPFYRTFD